jgi:hypothetical protein
VNEPLPSKCDTCSERWICDSSRAGFSRPNCHRTFILQRKSVTNDASSHGTMPRMTRISPDTRCESCQGQLVPPEMITAPNPAVNADYVCLT